MPLSHLEKMKVSARHTVICLEASLVHCIPFHGRDCEYRKNYEFFILIREQKSTVTVNNIHVIKKPQGSTKRSEKSFKDTVLY